MARRVKDANLDTRSVRLKLKPRGKPYYRSIGEGLHLGYRRRPNSKNGKWVRREHQGEGKYVEEVFASADDFNDADGFSVLTFFQAQDRARERRGYVGPYRVRDAIAAYFVYLGERGDAVRERTEKHILKHAIADKQLAALDTTALRQWMRDQVKDDPEPEKVRRSKSSANRVWGILRGALNMAFRDGKVDSDLAWKRLAPFDNVSAARVKFLTVEECQRLLNACDPDFRLLVRGALETGARYSELCRLRVGDYERDGETVHVRTSKSGKDRHIILTDAGAKFFEQLTAGRSKSDPMFGREWAEHEQIMPIYHATRRAKLDISFHGLRHTYASLSIMAGMSLPAVAANLGHSDTRMVELHYGHLTKSFVKDQVRKFAPVYGVEEETNVRRLSK